MNVDAYFDKPIDAQALARQGRRAARRPRLMRRRCAADERRQSPLPPAGHDHPGEVPPVLHLRARVPGQGHPDRGRPGERHPDALHRLRQLRHRLQPERQAGAQRHRGHRGAARRRRAGRGDRGAELPGRVHGVQHGRAGRRPPRPRVRRRPRGQLRRRPRGRGVRAPARASDDGRHIATTCPAVVSYVRKYHPDILDRLAPIVSPMLAIARVLHKKYGPGAQDRLHRALHRQEGRGALRAVRGRGARGAHLRGAPRPARRARRQPRSGATTPATTSTRRTAASAPSSPSRAACCRPPTSTRTC